MKRRKFLLGSAAALSGTGLLAGARGFSRTESQRAVRLEVENDEDAYLRVVPEIPFGDTWEIDCEDSLHLQLGNQAKEDPLNVVVDLELENGEIELVDDEVGAEIALGDEETVDFAAGCDPGTDEATADLLLEITADGAETDETLIEAHRELAVECSCDETGLSFVAFCGEDIEDRHIQALRVEADGDTATGLRWGFSDSLDDDISSHDIDKVVLFGGFGNRFDDEFDDFDPKQVFINFTEFETVDHSDLYDYRVEIDDEKWDQLVGRDPSEDSEDELEPDTGQSPDCPCRNEILHGITEKGVKFETEDGELNATDGESVCGGDSS